MSYRRSVISNRETSVWVTIVVLLYGTLISAWVKEIGDFEDRELELVVSSSVSML